MRPTSSARGSKARGLIGFAPVSRSVASRRRAGDGFLQILELLAALRTQSRKMRGVIACLGHVADLDVELALILERTLVVGIEVEGLAIKGLRRLHVAGVAQAEAEQVVDVGVLRALIDHRVESRDGA